MKNFYKTIFVLLLNQIQPAGKKNRYLKINIWGVFLLCHVHKLKIDAFNRRGRSLCHLRCLSTHPEQLLVLLLQLALQVPHPLLDAAVTLLRLHSRGTKRAERQRERPLPFVSTA